jgi:hypothetical protein
MLLPVPFLILLRAVISLRKPFLPVQDFRKEEKKISENSPQKMLHSVVP